MKFGKNILCSVSTNIVCTKNIFTRKKEFPDKKIFKLNYRKKQF